MEELQNKIGFLSHILPPSPTGQSIMIYRILSGISHEKYCLLSKENYNTPNRKECISNQPLPARYYFLEPSKYKIRLPHILKLHVLEFIINSKLTIYTRAKQIEQIINSEKCKSIVACTGDFCDLPSAYYACKRAKVNFVPYIFDDYVYQWRGFQRKIAKYIERKIFKEAAAFIVTNEFIKEEYKQRYGKEGRIIRNPALDFYDEKLQKKKKEDGRAKKIVFTGAIYDAHYDAFQAFLKSIQKLNGTLELHVYTSTPKNVLEEKGLMGNYFFRHEHVPQSEIAKVLNDADFLYLPLAFESKIKEVIKTSSPGKMGEYMFVSKPIIVHAPIDSFISWYFDKNNCGIVINNKDTDEISKTLSYYMENESSCKEIGMCARECAKRDFSIEVSRAKFIELLNSL